MGNISRRRYLSVTALATLSAGIAGCSDDGEDGPTDEDTLDGADYPAVDEWLTETDIGAAAPNYDGQIVDWRDEDDITVNVGTGDTGTEYDPEAIAISSGTTVTWEWTGRGGPHNVEAEPDGQLGESDYEFSSGEPIPDEGNTFEQTFDEAGIALYHCEPHLSVGMKGAIVIE
ncbi:MAG: halocyanin domain-containing protein [Natrialbaceae archaeon]|nr:halocyanin domain-containing protein [Natrialbaceae archaeon]